MCYRCGKENHLAINCVNPMHCVLCAIAGKNPDHRVGSGLCKADLSREIGQLRQNGIDSNAMLVDEPEGGFGIEGYSNA